MVSLENAQGRGTTASRPASPVVGAEYFDTDLNKRVRWSGTAWEDAERSLGTTSTTAAAGNHTHTLASGDIPNNAANTSGTSGATNALKSATTTVNVSSATAPTTGQALVATGPSAATWQTLVSGFANPMTTVDDLIIGGASGAAARLAKGADGQVLTVDATTHHLVWADPAASGMTNPMTTAGDIILAGASGTPSRLAKGADNQVFTIDATTHLPVWATPSASVSSLAGESDVSISSPADRQFLRYQTSDGKWHNSAIQAADVPTLNQNTTGTAANVTGTVAIANGGTGQSTQQAAIDALAGTQSAGKYLRSDGTHTTLTTLQAADVPTLNQDTSGKSGSTDALKSATTTINVSASAAPSAGQALIATDGTHATWQTPAAGSGAHTIADEGTPLTSRPTLDFVGTGVTVTDDSVNSKTVVTIPGSSGGMTNPMTAGGDLIVGKVAGNKDAARAGTATATSASGFGNAAGVPANIIDGDDTSFVRTSDNGVVSGARMKVDLGVTAVTIDRFRLLQSTSAGFTASAYVIESSPDGTTYTTRHTVSSAGGDSGTVTLSSGPITAQYWQARATAGGTSGWQVFTFSLVTPTTTGAGDPVRLAGGSDGQALVYDSTQTNNLKWSNPTVSNGLASASTNVNTSAATAPSAGQALIATDSTHMTWTAALKSLGAQTIGTTQVAITHSLGYTPTVCIAQMTSAGQIWRSAASSSTQVFLTADAAGRTCEVYVR